MTDAAFVAAMRDYPKSVAPQLVYADWLEERGDMAHALRLRTFAARGVNPFDAMRMLGEAVTAFADTIRPLVDRFVAEIQPASDAFGVLAAALTEPPPLLPSPSTSLRTIHARRLTGGLAPNLHRQQPVHQRGIPRCRNTRQA